METTDKLVTNLTDHVTTKDQLQDGFPAPYPTLANSTNQRKDGREHDGVEQDAVTKDTKHGGKVRSHPSRPIIIQDSPSVFLWNIDAQPNLL